MKKLLLLFSGCLISVAALSQRRLNNNSSAASINVIPLGESGDAYSNFYIGKSLLQYDPNLNTVILCHTSNPALTGDPHAGYFRFDKSTDGGSTWLNNLGPVYGPVLNGDTLHNGSFPVATIGNPVGNTNPDSAFLVYGGIWNDSVVGTGWQGQCWGTAQLNSSVHTEHNDSVNALGNQMWVNDVFVTKQNVVWKIGAVNDSTVFGYKDSLRIAKGTWNGSDYDFTYQDLYFHANTMLGVRPWDMNIAFSDNGLTGYVVCINNADEGNTVYYTGTMYMQMFVTRDGGVTWVGNVNSNQSYPLDVDVTFSTDGSSLSPIGSAWFGNPDSTFGVTGWGNSRPDFDMAVDGNGNIHIFVGVFPEFGFGETTSDAGAWGLVDIYSIDHGYNWFCQLIATPNTYYGNYGDWVNIMEGSRPFVSRSNDGNKLFFGWFDTPPSFSTMYNDYPDLFVRGLDLTTNLWTPVTNMTQGSAAHGQCQFGLGSYYVKDNACTYEIPAAYMNMQTNVHSVCNFSYIRGATLSCSDFTVTLPPPFPIGDHNPIGVNANIAQGISISAFPNPVSHSQITFTHSPLTHPADIVINNVDGLEVGRYHVQVGCTDAMHGFCTEKIKLPELAKGVYVARLVGEGVSANTKFVVADY
jgi:hypothetical protein